MEAKLREYRARHRRKEIIDNVKTKLTESTEKILNFFVPKYSAEMDQAKKDDEVVLLENEEPPSTSRFLIQPEENEDVTSEVSELESSEEATQESWKYFILKWTVYFIIWLTVYIIFLKLQFGAVYFVLSLLIGIYLNTRTRPKKKGEVSAYSVFNKNCTSIEGTLKAEQLQKQLLYGPLFVR